MKMYKKLLSLLLALMLSAGFLSQNVLAVGPVSNPKLMQYENASFDNGVTTQGYMYYENTAPQGTTITYHTIGFKMYFTSTAIDTNGNAIPKGSTAKGFQYWIYMSLDPSFHNNTTGDTTYWYIPFEYVHNPLDISKNAIINKMIAKYGSNAAEKQDIENFFVKGNTIFADHTFTIMSNKNPLGGFNPDGSFWGRVYTTEDGIKAAESWSDQTMGVFDQYYGKHCRFDPQPMPVTYVSPTAVISRDAPTTGTIIDTSTHFNANSPATLYGDRSIWPTGDYIVAKYYKWEYKKTTDSSYPATPYSTGIGKASVTFPQLPAGAYNVRLTVWYSATDGQQHMEKASTPKVITMYLDDAGIAITPTVDPDKTITQAQIDANVNINVNVSGLAQLNGSYDASAITEWDINFRKDPAVGDYQYQSIPYKTNLGITQSATKVFTIPAGVLKNVDSYTQKFALSAYCTVNGQLAQSDTVYCTITLKKEAQALQGPVAVLIAPDTVVAGVAFDLDGSKSYSPNGPIVSYHIEIPATGYKSDNQKDTALLPYGLLSANATLTVTDSKGMTATDTKTITVTAPVPIPHLSNTGKLKENRIAYFTVNDVYDLCMIPHAYGVDYTRTVWSVKAVGGSGASDSSIYVIAHADTDPLKVTGDPYSAGLLNGKQTISIEFKTPGQYAVTVTIYNSVGGSGTISANYTIVPDQLPVVKFDQEATVYRDTVVNGEYYATIHITDESYSPDGDYIGYRKIYAIYDANNNGTFGDAGDTQTVINESSDPNYIDNNKTYSIQVKDVGKYQINITAKEGFTP